MAEWMLWVLGIEVLGAAVVLFWTGKTIIAMRETVNTQDKTITAQGANITSIETSVKVIKTVLDAVDAPAWLARMKALEETHAIDKAADLRRLTHQFERERPAIIREGEEAGMAAMTDQYFMPVVTSLLSFARNTLPYVPEAERAEFINSMTLSGDRLAFLREDLLALAASSPDLSLAAFSARGIGLVSVLSNPPWFPVRGPDNLGPAPWPPPSSPPPRAG